MKVGQKAPDFSVTDDSGKTVKLSDFKGKKVVLYFYPKDDTPGCTTEACNFRDGLAAIRKKGAVVLGVSADSAESHKKFKDKFDLNFPLLADTDRKIIEDYDVWKQHFGLFSGGGGATSVAVPEPASWLFVVVGMVVLGMRRKRRHSERV